MDQVLSTVTRICDLTGEGKKKKHTFYCMNGKIGTVPAIVWYVDNIPKEGQLCAYFNEFDGVSPKASNFNMICQGKVSGGVCTKVNQDGYRFIDKQVLYIEYFELLENFIKGEYK